jgi:hypothetical protein
MRADGDGDDEQRRRQGVKGMNRRYPQGQLQLYSPDMSGARGSKFLAFTALSG